MDDLQKKLDELIILRDTLSELTSNFDLSKLQSIDIESAHTDNVQIIAQQHQIELKLNNDILCCELADVDQLVNVQIEHLINTIDVQIKQSIKAINVQIEQSTKTINTKFEHKNNESITNGINSLNQLINRINTDITTTSIELTRKVALDNIRNLCNTNEKEYVRPFLEACLSIGSCEFTQDMLTVLLTKIKSCCDWRFPGLQINPTTTDWIDCMVASDPLYLVNLSENSITPLVSNYSTQYQNRLRIYNIINQDFSILPQGQFGCISCCDFLNLYSLDIIKNYITTFFSLLRPGGNLICTIRLLYNPTILVDVDYFKYTAKLTIEKLFKDNGYELIPIIDLLIDHSNQECVFLIEARKPGVLTTSKAHQAIGAIIEK